MDAPLRRKDRFFTSTEFVVRVAVAADSEDVSELNLHWLEAARPEGFLHNRFTPEQVATLIQDGAVVVGRAGGTLAGYYLADTQRLAAGILSRQRVVDEFVEQGKLPVGRYVLLTQAAVRPEFMRRGLARVLLTKLKQSLSSRADFFVGFIDSKNTNAFVAHKNAGWVVFAEVSGGVLAYVATRG